MRSKIKELRKIAKEIENCRVCKLGKSGKAVVGEGSPDAKIAFIGEAPGKQEALSGRPFIGRSGQLLRLLIRESGLKEEDVYITSPVKYLPDRGTPTPKDIAHGKTHLDKQLNIINPKIIVLLGSVAVQALLGRKIPILSDHGKIINEGSRRYFVTLHPAAAIRFAKNKPLLIKDFKKLNSLLDKL